MIKFKDGQFADMLPSNMARDVETQCISYALKKQIERIIYLSDQTRTVAMIDLLPEKILDVLAVELRTPYYQESMDLGTKRNIIKKTLLWHTKAGTPKAVAELIEIVFGVGSVVEWFDYDEPPYTPGTFDIVTNAQLTEEMANYFLSIIQRVKNTRSHIRRILIEREMEMEERVAVGTVSSPREAILNHQTMEERQDMKESVAAGAVASPAGTITNAPQTQSGITSDTRVATGARAEPHEIIGNNVDPRTRQTDGSIYVAAVMAASTKLTIYNGAFMTKQDISGKQNAAVAGAASHSKITI